MQGVPNCNFPTDNDYEIPVLNLELQGDVIDVPVRAWGGKSKHWRASRSASFAGTWHFYVDDAKFSAVWKHPDTALKSGAPSMCEVNYSIGHTCPVWRALQLIGQKRWISCYWQKFGGKRIFVDLNVAEKVVDPDSGDVMKDLPALNLIGVPKGWKAYSTRGSINEMEKLRAEHALACEHAGTKEISMLVYGGGKKVQEFCKVNRLEHFSTEMTAFHAKKKA